MNKIKIYQSIERFLQNHTEAEVLTLLGIITILIIIAIVILTKLAIKRQKEYMDKIIDERITKMQEKQGTDKQAESEPQKPQHFMTQMEYDQYKREHGIK